MKKIVYILLLAFALFSCQKPPDNPPLSQEKKDVVFAGIATEIGSAKSTQVDCDNPDATYAKVKIDDIIYRPLVFYIDGQAYTQSIKLTPGVHSVNEFMLMNDNNTPGNYTDDIIVSATPLINSTYAQFVTKAVDFTFDVGAFAKTEVPIDVLCFDDADYQYFGFDWFALTEITVREQVFFGDICVSNPSDYAGSLYAGQANGLQPDMPAIFRIDVYKNGAYIISYDNSAWLGEGNALEVQYPDNNNATDIFDFKLFILVRENDVFVYKYFYTWTFNNDEKIAAGIDNVVDFALGDCNINPDWFIKYPETAFAYSENYATCFFDILQGLSSNKWGWSNGTFTSGNTYVLDLYAGAGQCDLGNGRKVGQLTVNYTGTEAAITYTMDNGYLLSQAHLYAGTEILPRKNGNFTVSPGQFPHKDETLNGASSWTKTVKELSGPIYVVAHAEVIEL